MFRSKSLLCCKNAALASSKVVSKSNNIPWTKQFNKENKYLFGDLLESKSDLRKKNSSSKEKEIEKGWEKSDNVTKYDFNQSVPLDKIEAFPMINSMKNKFCYSSSGIINLDYSLTNHSNERIRVPSVSAVLSDTMSEKAKAALENWKKRMIEKLGEEQFQIMNKEKLEQGSSFHGCIKSYLLGNCTFDKLINTQPNMFKLMTSLQHVLKNITNVTVVESEVIHSNLPYRGYVDCVAKYRGYPTLIEWKHSDKKKPYISLTYDAPIQMSAYLGAINYDDNYKIPVKNGLVIVAYTDGSPADVFYLRDSLCDKYWKQWLKRLYQFVASRTDNLAVKTENGTCLKMNITN